MLHDLQKNYGLCFWFVSRSETLNAFISSGRRPTRTLRNFRVVPILRKYLSNPGSFRIPSPLEAGFASWRFPRGSSLSRQSAASSPYLKRRGFRGYSSDQWVKTLQATDTSNPSMCLDYLEPSRRSLLLAATAFLAGLSANRLHLSPRIYRPRTLPVWKHSRNGTAKGHRASEKRPYTPACPARYFRIFSRWTICKYRSGAVRFR